MLRRRHKKSRAGCLPCKKRHIKCDESRPTCVNCSTGSIQCSFSLPAKHITPSSEPQVTLLAIAPKSTPTTSTSSSPRPSLVQVEPYVNATHVELFYWITESNDWAFQEEEHKAARPHVLKHAFAHPFLLNELLAVSALHLSTCRPTQQSFYREEATRLQSHALRMFNETIRDLNLQNIIPSFLFSVLQGIATFFETFHEPGYEASDWKFFENIIQSVRLLQGVRSIVVGWWEFLITSDIQDILREAPPDLVWSDEVVDRFEAFRVEISQSSGLDQAQSEVCDQAMEELVSVYKIAFGSGTRSEISLHGQRVAKYATKWLMIVPLPFTELLVGRKPEALMILAYFAVMLHKLRACWTVGQAGKQLLLAVESHLESSWSTKLSWPKSFIAGE